MSNLAWLQELAPETESWVHELVAEKLDKLEHELSKTSIEPPKALEKMRKEVTKQFGQPPTREEAILILKYIDEITGEKSHEETRSRSD